MQPIVPPEIEAYCTAHSSAPSALLVELQAYTTRNCADAQMLIGPLEAAFLQMLVRLSGARRVLEVGTFTGYSALAMAEALPADGTLLTCEIDPDRAAIARRFFERSPHGRRIELRLGAARESLRGLPPDDRFDMAFIDADKEGYLEYYDAILPRLSAGGLLVADNTLWSGDVLDPQRPSARAVDAFNRHVREDDRVAHVLVPLRDGVMLVRKR